MSSALRSRLFGAPGQNVVYADVDGHIGYQATGFIPIRASGDGSLPVPGDTDAYEWTGFIPYDEMPRAFDPPSGILATANGRITPDGYPHSVSFEWDSPYRTERIYKLLSKPKKYTPADMLEIQTDVVSELDRFCAERFVYAIDHTPKASDKRQGSGRDHARVGREHGGGFGCSVDRVLLARETERTSAAAEARRRLEGLLALVHAAGVAGRSALSQQSPQWLPSDYASYDELLTAAVEAAVTDSNTPRSLSFWTWGRVHQIDIKHPFWSNFPILKRAAGPGAHPWSGDGVTVKQAGQRFGPSERFTADLSDLDNSTLNIVNGQSGNLFDDHYDDQWDAFYNGRTFKLPFSPEAVAKSAQHQLKLQPAVKLDAGDSAQ